MRTIGRADTSCKAQLPTTWFVEFEISVTEEGIYPDVAQLMKFECKTSSVLFMQR